MLWSSFVSAAVILTSSGATFAKPTPAPKAPNYWFSFGDSYTATGFNSTTGPLPSIGNPFGNPAYPGETGAGGVNWIDYSTVQYNHSLILTYNLAYSGAVIDEALVTQYRAGVYSLTDQVAEFLGQFADKPKTTPWTSADSIFSFWIGVNDIGNHYYQPVALAPNNALIDQYFKLITELFLLEPKNVTASLKPTILDFNAKLAQRLALFKATHPLATIWTYDTYKVFNTILDNPKAYGFTTNATAYSDDPGYFWGNDYHPSPAAHNIFAKDISKILSGTPW